MNFTSSLTATPPNSRSWFQVSPHSLRLRLAGGRGGDPLVAPRVVDGAPLLQGEGHRASNAAQREIAGDGRFARAGLPDVGGNEPDLGVLRHVEEVGGTEVFITLVDASIDAAGVDRGFHPPELAVRANLGGGAEIPELRPAHTAEPSATGFFRVECTFK